MLFAEVTIYYISFRSLCAIEGIMCILDNNSADTTVIMLFLNVFNKLYCAVLLEWPHIKLLYVQTSFHSIDVSASSAVACTVSKGSVCHSRNLM